MDVFGEVSNDDHHLAWFIRSSWASDALNVIAPKAARNEYGRYGHGDNEFSVSKEMLQRFKDDIITFNSKEGNDPIPVEIMEQLAELQTLIDTHPFDTRYLTIHTD